MLTSGAFCILNFVTRKSEVIFALRPALFPEGESRVLDGQRLEELQSRYGSVWQGEPLLSKLRTLQQVAGYFTGWAVVILSLANKLIFADVITIVIDTVYILKYKAISKEESGVHSSSEEESWVKSRRTDYNRQTLYYILTSNFSCTPPLPFFCIPFTGCVFQLRWTPVTQLPVLCHLSFSAPIWTFFRREI